MDKNRLERIEEERDTAFEAGHKGSARQDASQLFREPAKAEQEDLQTTMEALAVAAKYRPSEQDELGVAILDRYLKRIADLSLFSGDLLGTNGDGRVPEDRPFATTTPSSNGSETNSANGLPTT